MNKQELIDKLKATLNKADDDRTEALTWETIRYVNGRDYDKGKIYGKYEAYDYALDLANQLNEPEHEKATLPKSVGEELDAYKAKYPALDFDDFIMDVVNMNPNELLTDTIEYYNSHNNSIIDLSKAWIYGWIPEKETLYNVHVPHTDLFYSFNHSYQKLETRKAELNKDTDQQFTLTEIKQYGLEDCERMEVEK